MIKNKKGQFFILAAVIISAVVIGISATKNYVSSTREPQRFYDLSEELKEESSFVIDYGVLNDEEVLDLVEKFTTGVALNLRDQYPDLGFVFVYGNQDEFVIENYGEEKSAFKIGDEDGVVRGANEEIESNINLELSGANFNVELEQSSLFGYSESWRAFIDNPPENSEIVVTINDQNYNFKLRKNEQFFIVLLKSEGAEEYVDIK